MIYEVSKYIPSLLPSLLSPSFLLLFHLSFPFSVSLSPSFPSLILGIKSGTLFILGENSALSVAPFYQSYYFVMESTHLTKSNTEQFLALRLLLIKTSRIIFSALHTSYTLSLELGSLYLYTTNHLKIFSFLKIPLVQLHTLYNVFKQGISLKLFHI